MLALQMACKTALSSPTYDSFVNTSAMCSRSGSAKTMLNLIQKVTLVCASCCGAKVASSAAVAAAAKTCMGH